MLTKLQVEITESDLIGCTATRGHADGTVTLYYEGDAIPDLPVVVVPPTRYVTAQEYRARFTDAELLAMLASADPMVKLLVLKVSTAAPEGIDVKSNAVWQGLAYLVSVLILEAHRPAEIVG